MFLFSVLATSKEVSLSKLMCRARIKMLFLWVPRGLGERGSRDLGVGCAYEDWASTKIQLLETQASGS